MSEFGGLWKHEHNQHALVPPRRNVAAQVVEELKTVTYLTPPMEERRKIDFLNLLYTLLSLSGNMGCLTWVMLQQLPAARVVLPSNTSACWVFLHFRNLPNSDTDYKIFNGRTWSIVCVHIHTGVGHTDKSAQHFWLRKTVTNFVCAPDEVQTSGFWILSLTLYQLSHPITPEFWVKHCKVLLNQTIKCPFQSKKWKIFFYILLNPETMKNPLEWNNETLFGMEQWNVLWNQTMKCPFESNNETSFCPSESNDETSLCVKDCVPQWPEQFVLNALLYLLQFLIFNSNYDSA